MGVGKTEYERLIVAGREIAVSHPGKVLFPKRGFTKLDLVRYYLAVADGALRDMRLVLHEAGIDPRRIVCEVTEQKSASSEALHGFVQALRSHGFRIAVDDYGAHDSDIERIRALIEQNRDGVRSATQWLHFGPASRSMNAAAVAATPCKISVCQK